MAAPALTRRGECQRNMTNRWRAVFLVGLLCAGQRARAVAYRVVRHGSGDAPLAGMLRVRRMDSPAVLPVERDVTVASVGEINLSEPLDRLAILSAGSRAWQDESDFEINQNDLVGNIEVRARKVSGTVRFGGLSRLMSCSAASTDPFKKLCMPTSTGSSPDQFQLRVSRGTYS